MQTKARDLATQRERGVSSLFHRVSPGKWLALIFFARVGWMATGCSSGPAAGTLGGKCVEGCENATCNDGSVCDEAMDLCVATSGDGQGPGACSEAYYSSLCDSNGQAFLCNDPASSEDPRCAIVATTDATTTFCCEFGPLIDESGVHMPRDAGGGGTIFDADVDDADADVIVTDAGDR
jgi:hypothetical protein